MAGNAGRSGSRYLVPAAIVIVLLVVAVGAGLYLKAGETTSSSSASSGTSNGMVRVVAGENFWGSLVSQLGGTHVSVLSVVSDPNADPHQYASNSANAQAVANAGLVIVNGAGYDDWALRLISAGTSPNQKVLNVADLLGKKQGDNPHLWYDPVYVNETVHAMYTDLVSIDSSDAAYFHQQYASLNASLYQTYMSREVAIKQQFGGTPVASTESMFEYMAKATGLNLVSPPSFMESVAEGNDPSAQDVATFQQQLEQKGTVKVLVFNAQTVTPLTDGIKALAAQKGIPTVAITETVQPPGVTFQDWMSAELVSLQNALAAQAVGP